MSKPIDDGGPAFPTRERYRDLDRGGEAIERERPGPHGMTLRDYFAGQIAAGDAVDSEDAGWGNNVSDCVVLDRVKLYYRIADAMLAARKGGAQ